MAIEADLYLELAGDFVLTSSGDLALAQEWDQVRQRIERRIFTNAQGFNTAGQPIEPEYFFDTTYGYSARAMIGDTFTNNTLQTLEQIIYAGTLTDQGVNGATLPVITYSLFTNPNQVEFQIQVTLVSGQQGTIVASLP